ALPARDGDYTALVMALEAEAPGEAVLILTHYIDAAGWRPFYEVDLTRKGEAALALDRSVLVTQYTGEDWTGVDLVLSSSRPSEQAWPSTLWPELRSIGPEEPPVAYDTARAAGAAPEMEAVPAAPVTAE